MVSSCSRMAEDCHVNIWFSRQRSNSIHHHYQKRFTQQNVCYNMRYSAIGLSVLFGWCFMGSFLVCIHGPSWFPSASELCQWIRWQVYEDFHWICNNVCLCVIWFSHCSFVYLSIHHHCSSFKSQHDIDKACRGPHVFLRLFCRHWVCSIALHKGYQKHQDFQTNRHRPLILDPPQRDGRISHSKIVQDEE